MLVTPSAVPGVCVCVSTQKLTCPDVCNEFNLKLLSSHCSKNGTVCICMIRFLLENQKGKVQGTCRVPRL